MLFFCLNWKQSETLYTFTLNGQITPKCPKITDTVLGSYGKNGIYHEIIFHISVCTSQKIN